VNNVFDQFDSTGVAASAETIEPQQALAPAPSIGDVINQDPGVQTMRELVSINQNNPYALKELEKGLQSATQKAIEMYQLRQKNPALAAEIEGTPQYQKSLIGIGRGMHDIARGAGFIGEEQATEELNELERFSAAGGAPRMVGQAAPFAPAAAAVPLVTSGIPAALSYSTIGAAEGYTSATGEGKDPTLRTALGAAVPIGGELLARGVSKGAEKYATRSAERSRILDNLRAAEPENLVDEIEEIARLNKPDAPTQIAKRLADAQEAGVDHPTIKRLSESTQDAETAREVIKSQRKKAIQAESAQYKLSGPQLKNLKKSGKAKKLSAMGVPDSDIQVFAGASSADKAKLRKIVRRAIEAEKDAIAKIDIHPQAVVGESLESRLKYVDSVNKKAGARIDKIADEELRGRPIDLNQPLANFKEKLDKMGVTFNDGAVDYSRSALRGMPDQQKQIDNVIEQLSPQGMPNADAYDAHILKQWFDNQINWGKSPSGAGGIPPKVERAIKDLRKDVNTEIGLISDRYKTVNTTYSETIDGLNELKALAGRDTDINGEFIDETLGMMSKRITSNAMSRGRVKKAMQKIDDLAAKYGRAFPDSMKHQIAAVNALEKRLGSFSDTSLKGQTQMSDFAVGAADAAMSPLGPFKAGIDVLKAATSKKGKIDRDAFLMALDDILKGK
jgi:hypothetical protein